MKTLLIILSIVALSSCKKSYTCACEYRDTGNKFEYDLAPTTKGKARRSCDDMNKTWQPVNASCHIENR